MIFDTSCSSLVNNNSGKFTTDKLLLRKNGGRRV